jgi:hypothetical protein
MIKRTEIDPVYMRGLLEQRIVQLRGELAKAKDQLARLDSQLSGASNAQPKRASSKTKRIEELLMSVITPKGMTIKEILEAVRAHDPNTEFPETLIRRTLSRLGKAGELENVARGIWRQRDFISKTLGV